MLTRSQKEASRVILDRLQKHTYSSLTGYAGTGKTYLIGELLEDIKDINDEVYLCAPTHKAKQVLYEKCDRNYKASTIHSFLNLKLEHDYKGGYTLKKMVHKESPQNCIVVVDEASMIGMDEWEFITEENTIKWLFVGDPAQLPPVNEDFSPAIDKDGYCLQEIVRQVKDNPIVNLAEKVRKGKPSNDYLQEAKGDHIRLFSKRKSFLQEIVKEYKEIHENTEKSKNVNAISHTRILAYRNKLVNRYNNYIRKSLYGKESPRFVHGDWLVAQETWGQDSGPPTIINSQEFRVEDTAIDTVMLNGELWKSWKLTVRNCYNETHTIPVLHEAEFKRYRKKLKDHKEKALAKNKGESNRSWKFFYDLKERFVNVEYAYAMTVHKAQGSTFEKVFVDHRDLKRCKLSERKALIYVAVTRPSKDLVMLL